MVTKTILKTGIDRVAVTVATQNRVQQNILSDACFHEKSDTTEWFITSPEYTTFQTSETASFLWYPGPPKTGKSVLVGRIHLEQMRSREELKNIYGAYYSEPPMDGKSHMLNTIFPYQIFRSLLSQVLLQSMDTQYSPSNDVPASRRLLHPSVKPLLSKHGSDWDRVFCSERDFLPEGSNEAMKNLLQITLTAIKPKRVSLTIDDVDHMTVRARESFLNLLLQTWKVLQTQYVRVHILVTSRPYSDIASLLEDVPTILQYREYKG